MPNKPLSKPISLSSSDTLKVLLTVKEDRKAKQPHQVFLLVQDTVTRLDTSFALSVKDNGKAKVELVRISMQEPLRIGLLTPSAFQTQKDIPAQLLTSSAPLSISLVIASFGSSKPYHSHAFDLSILDPTPPPPSSEIPLRYGKLLEIHHTFKSDPTSPPKIITMLFTAAVISALPVLAITVNPSQPRLSKCELTS